MAGARPQWLPEGWQWGVRGTGGKAKVYTHPTNGMKFYSKSAVLRHINGEAHVPRRQSKRNRNKMEEDKVSTEETVPAESMEKTETNVVSEEITTPENLPLGWIKILRKTKTAGGKIRKDTYYRGPGTRQFRSMADVSRYLKNHNVGTKENSQHYTEVESEGSSVNTDNKVSTEREVTGSAVSEHLIKIAEEFDIRTPEQYVEFTSEIPLDLSVDDYTIEDFKPPTSTD